MPSRSRKNISYDEHSNSLPDLNASALQGLTQRIQDTLHGSSKAPFRPQTRNAKKGKLKISEKPLVHERKSPSVVKEQRNARSSQPKSTAQKKTEQSQGKKRLRNGGVKDNRNKNKVERSNANTVKLGSGSARPALADDGGLEKEVLALGGTTEDLELLREADSDSELDGDKGVVVRGRDVGLKNELLRVVQGLGIQKAESRVLEDEVYTDEDFDDDGLNEGYAEKETESSHIDVASYGAPAHTKPDRTGVQSVVDTSRLKTKGKAQLVFQPLSEWHSFELPLVPQPKQQPRALPLDLSDRIHAHAKALLEKENATYGAHHGSASTEQKFYSTLMATGTLSDKISALTLSVQESPLHNMKALEGLVTLAGKRSRDQAVNVLGALKDLFGPGNLLPSDRRLRNFASQPALAAAFSSGTFHSWTSSSPLPKSLQDIHLISFAYEDWLKIKFFEVLQILEQWCSDEVAYARGKAVDYVSSLLKDKPEGETNLLRLLVNKLGDSDKRIASKTSFNILQLETTHPLMKPTIISAIESDILFKPHQSLHAQYYAAITLNQTVLSTKEEDVARKLLDIYFNLFAKLLKRPNSDLQKANAPTSTTHKITVNKKGEIQGGGGPAGRKALKKQKAATKSTVVEEDLREKMLSAVLTGVNRAIPYTTTNDDYFEGHLDTLYRVTHSSNFNTSIQALMLIQQMNGINQGSQDRFYRVLYESLLDPRLLTSSKQALYLNLLFRALRSDLNLNRLKAFVKRLLQVIAMHQPAFACGVLYLLRELESVFPSLATLIDEPEDGASDGEESFHDIDDAGKLSPTVPDAVLESSAKQSKYDPRKRDPSHNDAATTSLWELLTLTQHYHPSVSLFAARLLGHHPMPPKPDLQQNTLISFLDRFVYKNPKSSSTTKAKGASIMQPLIGGEDGSVLLSAHSGATSRALPMNSDAFWRQESEKVGADEVFFHKYFSTVKKKEQKKREKKAKKNKNSRDREDSDNEEGGEENEDEEEEEAEVWKALVESRSEIEGDDGDLDLDFSDDDSLAAAMNDADDDESDFSDIRVEEDSTGVGDSDGLLDLGDGNSDVEMADDDGLLPGNPKLVGTPKAVAMDSKDQKEDRKAKRRRLKNTPTFASADDYAEMLADGSDEDGG